jgi:hypothetical protein
MPVESRALTSDRLTKEAKEEVIDDESNNAEQHPGASKEAIHQGDAQDAVREVHKLICEGYTDVVDADLSKYLDRVPYCPLVIEKAPAADRPL